MEFGLDVTQLLFKTNVFVFSGEVIGGILLRNKSVTVVIFGLFKLRRSV